MEFVGLVREEFFDIENEKSFLSSFITEKSFRPGHVFASIPLFFERFLRPPKKNLRYPFFLIPCSKAFGVNFKKIFQSQKMFLNRRIPLKTDNPF